MDKLIELPAVFFAVLFLYRVICAMVGIEGRPWVAVNVSVGVGKPEAE